MPNPDQNSLPEGIEARQDLELINKHIPFVKFLRMYHQYRTGGIKNIPPGRAMILVNHSLATYDILLLGHEIFTRLNRLPRALADRQFYKNPVVKDYMHKMGVVEGKRENAELLLQQEELLIIAPGGMRESLRPSTEKYQIKWEKRKGFARMAIRTQSPVVLAACPVADDMYEVKKSWVTKMMYRQFKLPMAVAQGLGLSMLPKPVRLSHFIAPPIQPPKMAPADQFEEQVDQFHEDVISRMNYLMEAARKKQ